MEVNLRKVFFDELYRLAEHDNRIILITGDVGFSYLYEFIQRFPNQFLNAGVTEQSFMGLAAGMALAGWKPYVYSMVPFVCFRNFEQLRNDVCYHNANVKIIGVRGSIHYRFLGFSHNMHPDDEDVKVIGHLPNLVVFTPETPDEVAVVIKATYEALVPTYIRI